MSDFKTEVKHREQRLHDKRMERLQREREEKEQLVERVRTLEGALRPFVERCRHSGLCVPLIDGKMGEVTEESCVCEPVVKRARAALRGGEK